MSEKKYIIDNQTLMNEWNWDKNEQLKIYPSNLTSGSNKKVWWKCGKGHEWESTIVHRSAGQKCPFCANHKLLKGYNDLATIAPHLIEEWNYKKNNGLLANDVFPSSNKKIWWICKKGHEWQDTPNHRYNRNNGCPYCSNHRVFKGHNDLKTTHPLIAKQWNYAKNGLLKPTDVLHGSNQSVWWKCEKGHEWKSPINIRKKVNECPYCNNRKLLVGFNDLTTYHPLLIKEWNYEKNNDLKPTMFFGMSNKIVWWKCEKGHEWQAPISARQRGSRCPFCANKKSWSGYNDLLTTNPELAKEWHPTKNKGLYPNQVLFKSNLMIWWKCEKGHEWEDTISNRRKGINCPYCDGKLCKNNNETLSKIYPELLETWHPNRNCLLLPHNISFKYRNKLWWKCENEHEWQATIKERLINKECPICKKNKLKKHVIDNNMLMKEWDWDKNRKEGFIPQKLSNFSNKKVNWKCEKGHEWQEIIANRTKRNSGCPYCSNHRILEGYNDLITTHPNISKEWNYNKNIDIDIHTIGAGSNKRVWWICNKGHEWCTTPNHRTSRGTNCPICSISRRISFPEKTIVYYLKQVFDDVKEQAKFPWLGTMEIDIYIPSLSLGIEYDGEAWHKDLKRDILKEKKCLSNGIELIRVREPGCPLYNGKSKCIITENPKKEFFIKNAIEELIDYFNKKFKIEKKIQYDFINDYTKIYELIKTEIEENNLEKKFPNIAKEWNFVKNKKLLPNMFAPSSNVKIWWKCIKGHEWQTRISERTLKGNNCPYCSNQRLLVGFNDLKTKFPQIADEWNYDKNQNLKTEDVTYGTNKKVWWRCERGHDYQARVHERTRKGNKCPVCSNHKILKGYNDLDSQFPDLMKEWDFDKNEVSPYEISYHYDNKVFWICENGHSYEASVYSRVQKKTGCPVCANQKIASGYNDLLSKNPKLASEWDYNKNKISPSQVAEQSNIKFWWKCEKGHSYEASPSNRFKGRGCPYCSNHKILPGYNDLVTIFPNIIDEWDYEQNMNIQPNNVSAHSSIKVFWKCKLGHTWKAAIRDRTSGGTNCPVCYKENRKRKNK